MFIYSKDLRFAVNSSLTKKFMIVNRNGHWVIQADEIVLGAYESKNSAIDKLTQLLTEIQGVTCIA